MTPVSTQSSASLLRQAPPIPFRTAVGVCPTLPDVRDVHVSDLPQSPLGDDLSDTDTVGVEAEFVVDHVDPIRCLCRCEHSSCLVGIHSSGFLAEHMRSSLDGRKSLGLVEECRGSDAYQIEFVGLQHRLPIIVCVRYLELRGCAPSTLHPRGGQSDNICPCDVAKRWQIRGLCETRPDDPHLHVPLLRCVPAAAGPGSPGANLLGC